MADEFITWEVHGDGEILAALAVMEHKRKKLRDLLNGMANYGMYWLRMYVPVYSGYTLRHADHTNATWRPGGPGGGGSWEANLGIKRGDSRHPLYAHQGTGIYAGRGLIRPHHPTHAPGEFVMSSRSGGVGNVLAWQDRSGQWVYRNWVRGQKPNPFLYMTYQQIKLYARARIHVLGREMIHPV